MTTTDIDKRKAEIGKLVETFCAKYIDDEHLGYARNILDAIMEEPDLSISRGKPEIWAAAIVYAMARLNFLFDPEAEHFLRPDTICDFFGTKKSTVGNKATMIEEACDICMGDPGFSRPEITEMLTVVELPNGMILPKSVFDRMILEDRIVGEEVVEESGRIKEKRAPFDLQRIREEQEQRDRIKREQTEKKRQELNRNQFSMFDKEDA